VKTLLPLALLGCVALTSCTTLANRRDLYSPVKGKGPYTDQLREIDFQHAFDNTPAVAPNKNEPLPKWRGHAPHKQ